MKGTRRFLAAAGLCVAVAGSGGCDLFGLFNVFAPARLTDGGGGNILTAGVKVATGQMTTLTQDEMQVLNDQVGSLLQAVDPNAPVQEMTNEQADGLIDFLQQNSLPGSSSTGLNSIEDIQAFAEAAQADPSILVVPQTLIDAYTGTIDNIDTENINVDELFSQLLGGLGGTTGGTTEGTSAG